MTRRSVIWLVIWLVVAAALLAGCRSAAPEAEGADVPEGPSAEQVEVYLAEHVGFTSRDGEVFCAYVPLEAEDGAEDTLYAWAHCQEYVLERGGLARGSGISVPVALEFRRANGGYEIVGHRAPRDGALYGEDVEAIFPRGAWAQINPQGRADRVRKNDRVGSLERDAEARARAHWGIGAP
ncbi:MAG: hypothetical protein GX649_00175 [Chloroflexi bacterium]|nr:hypothetical protein [Chloroflexota bacterium]